jgi:GNAT superfamily N-acetyltransferase
MTAAITIRPYTPDDRAAMLALAPRLVEGIAPWLEPQAFLRTAQSWLEGSIANIGPGQAVLLAFDAQERCAGFVCVQAKQHFTGYDHAYVGELVVAADVEGTGIGGALLLAAEQWARDKGFAHIALDTGAHNTRARGFYAHHGYEEESVHLVKILLPS